MISKNSGKSYVGLLVAFAFFGLALVFHKRSPRPVVVASKQESAININQNFLKLFSIGNKRMISDLIWIQTLIEADLERYQRTDMGDWLYLRFLTIAELDKNFYENYFYGGIYLSIIKDDLIGAADIYERGLKVFPNDYKLNYQAGFNYYFEMEDIESGLKKLEVVKDHPEAPETLKYLVNKLRFETTKNYDIALEFLRLNLANSKSDDPLRKKILSDIYALHALRDLECLNDGKIGCKTLDFEGQPYIQKGGKWIAPKVFREYKIFSKKSNLRPVEQKEE